MGINAVIEIGHAKPLTNAERRRQSRGPKQRRDQTKEAIQRDEDLVKQSDEHYSRNVKKIETWKELAARMCLRFNLSHTLMYSDYRYWQCRSCGFNPLATRVWDWWRSLDYRDRAEIHALSRYDRISRRSVKRAGSTGQND